MWPPLVQGRADVSAVRGLVPQRVGVKEQCPHVIVKYRYGLSAYPIHPGVCTIRGWEDVCQYKAPLFRHTHIHNIKR